MHSSLGHFDPQANVETSSHPTEQVSLLVRALLLETAFLMRTNALHFVKKLIPLLVLKTFKSNPTPAPGVAKQSPIEIQQNVS